MDSGFWRDRRVLVTGNTGFKGAWLAFWLGRLGADTTGLALAPTSPDGAFAALDEPGGCRVVDVRDRVAVEEMVRRVAPEIIFHLAACATVLEGYADPIGTYATNTMGTAHVLEAANAAHHAVTVVVVTSDKVYRIESDNRPRVEADALGGIDPYSASKACAELMVASYRESLFSGSADRVATARAGNVIGGGDVAPNRVLPDAIRTWRRGEPVRLRHPGAVRPWQHVLEPLSGYLTLAERLVISPDTAPPAVNFGPSGADMTVAELVEAFAASLGTHLGWEEDRVRGPHETPVLRLDSGLAFRALGWEPRWNLAQALERTADWYRAKSDQRDLISLAAQQLDEYAGA
jgi:CDP-glucose 4,6-dehydratase